LAAEVPAVAPVAVVPPPVEAVESLRGPVVMVTLGLAGFVVVIEVLQPLFWDFDLGADGAMVLPEKQKGFF